MWILTYSILVRLLSTLWGDEEEELFAVAAVQLPKVVAEAEIDEIFSQAAALAEDWTFIPSCFKDSRKFSVIVATTSKGQDTQV